MLREGANAAAKVSAECRAGATVPQSYKSAPQVTSAPACDGPDAGAGGAAATGSGGPTGDLPDVDVA